MTEREGVDPPLGWVPVEGRGSLPFALVHGESLVAAASWALGEAGVQLLDASVGVEEVRRSGRPLVLHDPLCPLTPVGFLVEVVDRSTATGAVVVGHRPVTDTVKVVHGDALGATVDRTGLRAVTSPVVIPGRVLAGLEPGPDRPGAAPFPQLVASLAERVEIVWVEAPPLGRRVHDERDLVDLEALSRATRSSAS